MKKMKNEKSISPLKVAVLQRVCPSYRVPLFKQLSNLTDYQFCLFIGDDIPNSKVKNAQNLEGILFKKLKTSFLKLGNRVFPWHRNLLAELKVFSPDVILCEAESHFLGYLIAILYRFIYKKNTALMYWCYIDLPGKIENPNSINAQIKRFFRSFFSAFILYSSYGKNTLLRQGFSDEQIFVTTNVGDVENFLSNSDAMLETPSEARIKLKLPDFFTVLYVGTLDKNKHPEVMVELAKYFRDKPINFVILGSGEMFENLKTEITAANLNNISTPGRITNELFLYYRASSVMLIPGRGGIAISEAMAFGIPVITYQADGTEFDLIRNKVTGIILNDNKIEDFIIAIEYLIGENEKCVSIGAAAQKLVRDNYNTKNMVDTISKAAIYSYNNL
jgi:glycosyltransferase involved in cell wall biosynthesis